MVENGRKSAMIVDSSRQCIVQRMLDAVRASCVVVCNDLKVVFTCIYNALQQHRN